MMVSKTRLLAIAAALLIAGPAGAKDYSVHVDARAMPWNIRMNPKRAYGYGYGDGKPAAMLWGARLVAGSRIRFTASGSTTTAAGGGSFGPEGQSAWTANRGGALFPSWYIDTKARVAHLNELVGAFVDADGAIVGEPFVIGAQADIVVPGGAAAIAMGINDDNYTDNSGGLDVVVSVREGMVSVEGG